MERTLIALITTLGLAVGVIAQGTGRSKGHCSTIRAGTWTPHVSTWPALTRTSGRRGAGRPRYWCRVPASAKMNGSAPVTSVPRASVTAARLGCRGTVAQSGVRMQK
jgi:hypothetical protein